MYERYICKKYIEVHIYDDPLCSINIHPGDMFYLSHIPKYEGDKCELVTSCISDCPLTIYLDENVFKDHFKKFELKESHNG